MSDTQCKVCGSVPNLDGERKHGKGCYEISEEGGGSDWPLQADAFADDFQLLNAALTLRCSRCNGAHLTMKDEEPIPGIPFPIYSYICRDCGLDSAKPTELLRVCCLERTIGDGSKCTCVPSNKDPVMVDKAWAAIVSSGVRAGQLWHHNKTGSTYRVVALSVDEVRLVPVVTYEGHPNNERRSWTRDLDVFLGKREDDGTFRFTFIRDQP